MSLRTLVQDHRLALYAAFSTLLVSVVIANALHNNSNFFSVAFALSQSNGNILALTNFAVLIALIIGRLMQQLFFGPLRPIEVERLYDRTWYFLTESLLAFTIFRDEFDVPFGLMFGTVLFLKCFHWLLADRIEWMDQVPYPGPSLLFHIRTNILFLSLWFIDLIMLSYTIDSMLTHGVDGIVLFGSEYAILMATLLNSMLKYIIIVADIRRAQTRGGEAAPPWEDKSMWIFYIELATDFLKLITYLSFFSIVMVTYGPPLNIIRDVYITARSFITRLGDLVRYRNATRNMDQRYPNVTAEELERMADRTCIICREEMVLRGPAADGQPPRPHEGPNDTPKKLPCGHFFHFHCLRSWLERQQTCPTCRRPVIERTPAAANPPPPQPGQAPAIQPNNVPGNNAGGLVGRMFGAGPIVPGQFAGGPIPPAAGPWQAGNAPNGHPPPFAHQPVAQQQLPQYPGFLAGGAWVPWGYDPRAAQAPPPMPEPAAAPPSTPTPTVPAASTATPEPTPTSPTPGEPGASEAPHEPLTPRQAAAEAALRRFGGPTRSPSQDQSPSSAQATQGHAAPSPLPAPTPTQPAETPSVPPSTTSTPPRAPSLIPLFLPSAARLPYPLHSQPSTPSTRQPYMSTQFSRPTSPLSRPLGSQQLPSTPLPPSLTEEQLGRLDQLTREALDERIRILENVQATAWRCMEELVRVRSVLPDVTSAVRQPQPPPPPPEEPVESPDRKGKGKETAPEASTSSQVTSEI